MLLFDFDGPEAFDSFLGFGGWGVAVAGVGVGFGDAQGEEGEGEEFEDFSFGEFGG